MQNLFVKAVFFVAKNKKVVRYRKPFHLNIGFITFGIIFIYMTFYVYSYLTSTHTSVYEVVQGTIAINNSYTGLALRSEEIFPTDRAGSINYYVKDASKVGVADQPGKPGCLISHRRGSGCHTVQDLCVWK